jgi:hypothetical protein
VVEVVVVEVGGGGGQWWWRSAVVGPKNTWFSYYMTSQVGLYIVTKSQFGWALRFHTLAEHPKGVGNNISIPQGRYINVWSYQVPCELGVTLA